MLVSSHSGGFGGTKLHKDLDQASLHLLRYFDIGWGRAEELDVAGEGGTPALGAWTAMTDPVF
jgi:hypothetical protein